MPCVRLMFKMHLLIFKYLFCELFVCASPNYCISVPQACGKLNDQLFHINWNCVLLQVFSSSCQISCGNKSRDICTFDFNWRLNLPGKLSSLTLNQIMCLFPLLLHRLISQYFTLISLFWLYIEFHKLLQCYHCWILQLFAHHSH